MLSEISSEQLSEWLAFENIEPSDDPFFRNAQLCQLMYALHSKKGKSSIKDWLPYKPVEPPPKPQTVEEQRSLIRRAISAVNKPK